MGRGMGGNETFTRKRVDVGFILSIYRRERATTFLSQSEHFAKKKKVARSVSVRFP